MPRKKLTKARVKSLLNSANASLYKLALDRLQHGTGSLVPISFKKLEEMLATVLRAINKK